jgi:hypothetical protein
MSDIKLSEKELLFKSRQKRELDLKNKILEIQLKSMQEMVDANIPLLQAQLELENLISQKEANDQNIKVLEKHIRDKKIVVEDKK